MNTRRLVLALLGLVGALGAPASAQYIHLSVEPESAGLLFHTSHAGSPWDRELGFVTKLDLYYDAEAPLVGMRPGKNWWQMRVDVPSQDHSFIFARPIDSILVWDHGMLFEFARFGPSVFEEFSLRLVFDEAIPTEGLLPIPPLPPLGQDEFYESGFSLYSGRTLFPVADVTEVYGGDVISHYRAEILPVPEPSTYAVGAMVLGGLVIVLRRRWIRRSAE